jgi:AraC-like DNA-binding protein
MMNKEIQLPTLPELLARVDRLEKYCFSHPRHSKDLFLSIPPLPFPWSTSKANLVELIYSFKACSAINDDKTGIKEISESKNKTRSMHLNHQMLGVSAAAKDKAVKIKSLLDKSFECIPTLSSLEKEFGLGKSYLQKGFRELYGSTIGKYAKQQKLIQIKELLKDYSLTLDTIAIRTGYNGGEALCRFFKMMEGTSPGVWRKKWLETLDWQQGNTS